MDSMDWIDYIIKLSTMVTATGILGNFLIKLYKKYVTDPDARMAEKIQKEYTHSLQQTIENIQKEQTESLKASVEPLTKSIELLNNNLQDSQADRKAIHKELDNHEERIQGLEVTVFKQKKIGEIINEN